MKTLSFMTALAVILAVASGCKRSPEPESAAVSDKPAAAHTEAPEIAWFPGDVTAAFEQARAENKPVFLYWGAVWCPPCHELKAHVFTRPDFVQKSRMFVAVYLDGDKPGAQKWGDEFKVSGYPTVVILRPDRTELLRLSGGMDLARYSEALDLALGDVRPIPEILSALESGDAPLSSQDCKRLAYYGWEVDESAAGNRPNAAASIQRAAERCPADAQLESARLEAIAAYMTVQKLPQNARDANKQLTLAIRRLNAVLDRTALAPGLADVLGYFDADFFEAVQQTAPKLIPQLRARWTAVMDTAAGDERYSAGDRLAAVNNKLQAIKGLSINATIPEAAAEDARRRIEDALATTPSGHARAGVVNSALNALATLGDYERAHDIASVEMETSDTPYYYMSEIAHFDEKLGRNDAALQWLERSYREAKGPATRFQWGANYVRGLIRMRPTDETAIRTAALEVLGELDGPDRIYRRTRGRLEQLDKSLQEWNAGGAHRQTIEALRTRMQKTCSAIPGNETAALETCRAFLANR